MKILTVIGARPQFVKACMLSRWLKIDHDMKEVIVHTGQHYDSNMSDVFFSQLNLAKPDYQLSIGSSSHGEQTGKMLIELEKVMVKEKPDLVLVYGDTNSTIAGGLAASKLDIPIAHVEAGLRSFNRKMPEEINRIVTDHLSSLLFCPSQTAVDHLRNEGIKENVYNTGDIMYDAVLDFKERALEHSNLLSQLTLTANNFYLATIHRGENTDDLKRLSVIIDGLKQLDLPVLFPLHPRTNKQLKKWNITDTNQVSNIMFIEPISYFDMLTIASQAKYILTDSGGLQKEAYMLKIPCLTLRTETEWTETIDSGWNQLVDLSTSKNIVEAVLKTKIPKDYSSLFGNGEASDLMYQHIKSWLK
ncbi:non-hydrolyzing UDP-N-acetylglucosamine 2-epimerase [Salicibibacter kimchii]|uniref:UDP-N-acetylglucosamine 2-epimerase (Non-hydrolyzing) n=1 Tax=Salicibibacter kimchii TaxID=2099786 RepID=A0A345BUD8_9BACI|nr:UDP-N-acetylglucosamine 2-epimerase (non-hydrolyzing) [Salicibibacter kimchii]AXF54569.1 UDP-N-acetylglucosamine 2-epimerase (non-hydrolyzing) [Salicibibacter kimchii]